MTTSDKPDVSREAVERLVGEMRAAAEDVALDPNSKGYWGRKLDEGASAIFALLERAEAAERERDVLLWVANALTCDWPESADIDGFEQQDLLLEAGLLEHSVVTEADMNDEWPHQWDLKPGDKCLRLTALGEKSRIARKPHMETE